MTSRLFLTMGGFLVFAFLLHSAVAAPDNVKKKPVAKEASKIESLQQVLPPSSASESSVFLDQLEKPRPKEQPTLKQMKVGESLLPTFDEKSLKEKKGPSKKAALKKAKGKPSSPVTNQPPEDYILSHRSPYQSLPAGLEWDGEGYRSDGTLSQIIAYCFLLQQLSIEDPYCASLPKMPAVIK